MQKTAKIALSLAITGLSIGFGRNMPTSAATINFELSFFDDNQAKVGSGEFSYDDEITTCFETSFAGVCDPSYEYFGFDIILVENALTSFSATIKGENWGDYYGHWWSNEVSGQSSGYQAVSRYGIDIWENRWFFGDPYFGERVMIMDINESSNTFGAGSWYQQILPGTGDPPIMASGTWQAVRIEAEQSPIETVPEPFPLNGALLALGLAYYSKRKQDQPHL